MPTISSSFSSLPTVCIPKPKHAGQKVLLLQGLALWSPSICKPCRGGWIPERSEHSEPWRPWPVRFTFRSTFVVYTVLTDLFVFFPAMTRSALSPAFSLTRKKFGRWCCVICIENNERYSLRNKECCHLSPQLSNPFPLPHTLWKTVELSKRNISCTGADLTHQVLRPVDVPSSNRFMGISNP